MIIYETIMKDGNPFSGYYIPIVSYEYEDCEQLNKDLIEILDEIEDFYKTTKPSTLVESSDGQTKTNSILTHNFKNFNIFDRTEYESILNFKNFVTDAYKHYIETHTKFEFKDLSIQCWGNKVGKFDYLSKHAHVDSLSDEIELSSNYFVKSPGHDTYTRYYSPMTINDYNYMFFKNVEGHLSIFPSFIQHDTTANRSSDNYRYTLGMDVMKVKPQNITEGMFVEL